MKKIFTLILLSIFLTSCGVSIESVVDRSVKQPFNHPLVIMLYDKDNLDVFTYKLRRELSAYFKNDEKQVRFILHENGNDKLTLNDRNSNIDSKINEAIVEGKRDLLLIFKPTNLSYTNGGLIAVNYQIIGINTHTKKEVWKANFDVNSSFGPSSATEKVAKAIFNKLKEDQIL